MSIIRARVAAVHRASLQLLHDGSFISANLSVDLQRVADPLHRPGVGDWVAANRSEGRPCTVTAVDERRSALVRRAPGDASRPQLLAANVDTALLFSALPHDVNPRRLARLAALAFDGGALPVAVLSRRDLATAEQVAEAAHAVQLHLPGVPCVTISALEDDGVATLAPWLAPDTTLALLGPSGAGKSTLVNRLAGAVVMATGATRLDGAGRHTTTHRALISLPGGVTVIDTPGLREVGMWTGSAGNAMVFHDVVALAEACRFRDCRHEGEPGCAVLDAVAEGSLDEARLEQWRQLQREVAWAERSVAEQRRLERVASRGMLAVERQRKRREQ